MSARRDRPRCRHGGGKWGRIGSGFDVGGLGVGLALDDIYHGLDPPAAAG